MARDYSRTQRVGDFLQRELAQLIQRELRDPRVQMVSVTAVEVSRDLAYAKVFFTKLGIDSAEQAKESVEVLNKASGYLRSAIARNATMRIIPKLNFRFDDSIGRGRDMDALLQGVRKADKALLCRGVSDQNLDERG